MGQGAVGPVRTLSVKVRGARAARAPGRRVNARVSRVCAHAGRACGRDVMRSARSGRAGEGRPARVCKRGAARVCRVRGGRGPRRWQGAPRASPRGTGSRWCTGAAGCYSPRLRGGAASRLPLGLLAPGSRLPAPGRPPAARTHRLQARPSPATPPLQCRPASPSEERGAGRGLSPAGAADGSCAAVRARSQEPAARSLALARPPPAPSLI